MDKFAELSLPSGKRATLAREPRGYDMERAYDLATTHSGNMIALALALFAQSGTIDGARKTYEELRHELSALDAYQIALWTNGNFAAGPEAGPKTADPGEGGVSPLG